MASKHKTCIMALKTCIMVCLEVAIPDEISDKRAVELVNRIITLGINEARIEAEHSPVVASEFYEILDLDLGQAMRAVPQEAAK